MARREGVPHVGPHEEGLARVALAVSNETPSMHRGGSRRFERLRVVIADDHAQYREGLARLLRASGIQVVGEAPTGEEAIRAVERTAPDAVIMDLGMPGISGLEATRLLSERVPGTRVIVLSVSAEDAHVADAFLAGASAYVVKGGPVEEVIGAIRVAAAGESPISRNIVAALLRRVRDLAQADVDVSGVELSSSEIAVLDLLAEGKTTYEIAESLELPPSDVFIHISSLLIKLRVATR
jgi:two-component system, NarL family, nitrate/nitrite response regulator NarL